MLHKSGDRVRYCYQKALEAREQALRTRHPELRQAFSLIEDHWIALAQQMVLTETLSTFGEEARRGIGKN